MQCMLHQSICAISNQLAALCTSTLESLLDSFVSIQLPADVNVLELCLIVIITIMTMMSIRLYTKYKTHMFCNVLQHNNPMYLRDLLTTHPSRNLRSSSQHLLSVGYMRTVLSSRCFKHSAALNWNDLPYDIRACDSVNVFKRKLAYPT